MLKFVLHLVFLILPGVLLGGDFAGDLWYGKDRGIYQRTHIHSSDAQYFAGLRTYEAVGGIIGGLPGMLILIGDNAAQKRARRKVASSSKMGL